MAKTGIGPQKPKYRRMKYEVTGRRDVKENHLTENSSGITMVSQK